MRSRVQLFEAHVVAQGRAAAQSSFVSKKLHAFQSALQRTPKEWDGVDWDVEARAVDDPKCGHCPPTNWDKCTSRFADESIEAFGRRCVRTFRQSVDDRTHSSEILTEGWAYHPTTACLTRVVCVMPETLQQLWSARADGSYLPLLRPSDRECRLVL